jgi:GNAT superfamily N-acetyltransferase
VSAPDEPGDTVSWPDAHWVSTAIGRRVTVRTTAGVTGPTGGPAFRDVVGVLESASESASTPWTVRTRTGALASVDPATVVAAKIVPDAPTRRRTASDIDITSLEQIAASAWQPLESAWLGDWVLRAAAGFTGRANSVLPLGDPGLPLDAALAAVTQWYAERALPAKIQVPLPLRADLDAALSHHGWHRHDAVAVMVCDLDPLRMGVTSTHATTSVSVDITEVPDPAWLATFRYGETPVPDVAVPMMTKTDRPRFASVRDSQGATLGIARGAVSGLWLGITALEVTPDSRRRGLGRRLIAALAEDASREGCRHAWLQVAHANVGAHALYVQLGFVGHHDYVYRQLGQHPQIGS